MIKEKSFKDSMGDICSCLRDISLKGGRDIKVTLAVDSKIFEELGKESYEFGVIPDRVKEKGQLHIPCSMIFNTEVIINRI